MFARAGFTQQTVHRAGSSYPRFSLTAKNLLRWVRWAGCFDQKHPHYIYICVVCHLLLLYFLLNSSYPSYPRPETRCCQEVARVRWRTGCCP
jgi:hypothetical protein